MIIDWLIYVMIVVSVALYVFSIWKAEKDEEASLTTSIKLQ
jgi:hypothetical protein